MAEHSISSIRERDRRCAQVAVGRGLFNETVCVSRRPHFVDGQWKGVHRVATLSLCGRNFVAGVCQTPVYERHFVPPPLVRGGPPAGRWSAPEVDRTPPPVALSLSLSAAGGVCV